jgi:hypothetical protein
MKRYPQIHEGRRVPRKSRESTFVRREVSLVKAMIERGDLNDQAIQAYFTRPGRTVNHARVHEIRRGKRYADVPPATERELRAFIASWPGHDYVTGLHPEDDELVVKAREAMLNAIQGYNNPRALFRSECFIVLAVVAWTYLLHWHFRKVGVDYRSKRDDGTLLTTTHGAVKHWELETCLKQAECPLEGPVKANMRFLIAIRHEIEHQMTKRIDDAMSAKIQACCLNFNSALKSMAGERCGIDRDTAFAIQLAGIEREQRNMLLKDLDLPPSLLAAQEAFEDSLPDEITRDERYAWRVILIHKNTNSKGAADEVVEFVRPGSDLEGEIHRVLRAAVEKTKYRPSDIVSAVQDAGFPRFKQHHHTLLVKAMDAKDKRKPYGAFVDIHERDWRWYKPWLDEVLKHCRKNAAEFAASAPSPGSEPAAGLAA